MLKVQIHHDIKDHGFTENVAFFFNRILCGENSIYDFFVFWMNTLSWDKNEILRLALKLAQSDYNWFCFCGSVNDIYKHKQHTFITQTTYSEHTIKHNITHTNTQTHTNTHTHHTRHPKHTHTNTHTHTHTDAKTHLLRDQNDEILLRNNSFWEEASDSWSFFNNRQTMHAP